MCWSQTRWPIVSVSFRVIKGLRKGVEGQVGGLAVQGGQETLATLNRVRGHSRVSSCSR